MARKRRKKAPKKSTKSTASNKAVKKGSATESFKSSKGPNGKICKPEGFDEAVGKYAKWLRTSKECEREPEYKGDGALTLFAVGD